MSEVKYVRDVTQLLAPIFESMLTPSELRSLTFWLKKVADRTSGRALPADTVIKPHDTWVRWQVLGEEGGSGSFTPDDGVDALVHLVQGELQDFITESHFGWGELRISHPLP